VVVVLVVVELVVVELVVVELVWVIVVVVVDAKHTRVSVPVAPPSTSVSQLSHTSTSS
jgi:hypothetical protein